jgi:hypothetical protein
MFTPVITKGPGLVTLKVCTGELITVVLANTPDIWILFERIRVVQEILAEQKYCIIG